MRSRHTIFVIVGCWRSWNAHSMDLIASEQYANLQRLWAPGTSMCRTDIRKKAKKKKKLKANSSDVTVVGVEAFLLFHRPKEKIHRLAPNEYHRSILSLADLLEAGMLRAIILIIIVEGPLGLFNVQRENISRRMCPILLLLLFGYNSYQRSRSNARPIERLFVLTLRHFIRGTCYRAKWKRKYTSLDTLDLMAHDCIACTQSPP